MAHLLVKVTVLYLLALAVDGNEALAVLVALGGSRASGGSFLLLALATLLVVASLVGVGSGGGLLGAKTLLLSGGCGLLTVGLDLAEGFDVFVLNFKELLGVFNCLIDGRLEQLSAISEVSVDLFESAIQLLDSFYNLPLSHLELRDLLVEIYLELVDGALQKDHLLALFGEVHSLVFGDYVVSAEL